MKLNRYQIAVLPKMPPDWELKTIGDLVTFAGGAQPPRSTFSFAPESGFVRLLQIRDFKSDKYATYIPEESTKKFCEADDVMIGRYGPPNFQIMRGRAGAYNVALIKATPKRPLEKDYLYYFLKQDALFRFIDARAQRTAGQDGIEMDELRAYPFPLPPTAERKRIIRILSTWDRAIELTEKLIAAKQKRKQALMQQLLTGKVRFKEFAEPWREVPLGTFVQEVRRPISWDDNKLYRLASIRRHSQGMFDRESLHGYEIKVKNLNQVHTNDFLISNIQAAYGAMGLVPADFHEAYISDQYTVLVPKSTDCFDIRFLGYLSETSWFRYEIVKACNGFFAERLRLLFYADELLKRKIYAPPSTVEQIRICDVLDAAVEELRIAQRRLAALKEQKKGLMQLLLTGKVRVKVDVEKVGEATNG